MKLVVGLGNPGKQYEKTKHNIGFMVIDAIADSVPHTPWREEQRAEVCSITVDGEKVLLVKPQTFMNLSGESVGPLMRYYKINSILNVVHSDKYMHKGMSLIEIHALFTRYI